MNRGKVACGSQTGYSIQSRTPRHRVPFSKYIVKPVFSDHIKQDIFLAFQAGGCLLLHEHYFHSAISNYLSITMSMSPEYMVA